MAPTGPPTVTSSDEFDSESTDDNGDDDLVQRDDQGLLWSSRVDGNLLKTLEKRMPKFKLSSDAFIEILFDLPPKELNLLLNFPQEEMFKRIFCYWKYLNEDRESPPPSRKTPKKFPAKIMSQLIQSVQDECQATTSHSVQDHGDDQIEHTEGDKGLKRRIKSGMEKLNLSDVLEPRPRGHVTTPGLSKVGQRGSASELELRTVVCHEPLRDVVPFQTRYWRFSSIWNWIQQLLAARRSRRVGIAPL